MLLWAAFWISNTEILPTKLSATKLHTDMNSVSDCTTMKRAMALKDMESNPEVTEIVPSHIAAYFGPIVCYTHT